MYKLCVTFLTLSILSCPLNVRAQSNFRDVDAFLKATLKRVKIYFTDLTPGKDFTRDTDTNLLTGAIIEKRQKGNRKPIIKTSHKKFATYLLKDFDFSNGFGSGID